MNASYNDATINCEKAYSDAKTSGRSRNDVANDCEQRFNAAEAKFDADATAICGGDGVKDRTKCQTAKDREKQLRRMTYDIGRSYQSEFNKASATCDTARAAAAASKAPTAQADAQTKCARAHDSAVAAADALVLKQCSAAAKDDKKVCNDVKASTVKSARAMLTQAQEISKPMSPLAKLLAPLNTQAQSLSSMLRGGQKTLADLFKGAS